jgi:hypothetical protein
MQERFNLLLEISTKHAAQFSAFMLFDAPTVACSGAGSCRVRCKARVSRFVHFVGVRVSFHIQTLRLPKMMQASTLGHNGIGCPATSTSGRITSRTNCAMAIRPNTTLATRNPVIFEFMLSSFLNAPAHTCT